MKYKESRRDAERDDRYGEKQRESRESRRDPERDDRYAERERESKEHRKDAERDDRYGERERESKEHRRDAERDDRYNEKERENKERRRDLERDDRYNERERENKESRKDVDHHRSKGARESAARAREDKEHSLKDERDLKFRGEKDSIRKDGKHSSSTEKHKAKEERIKEPSHRVRDDERGRESSKERDGERLKEEKHHRRREEEFVENRLQKRKEIDREERREKDEKRRRREEEGGFNLFHEKEDRGEKRKRDSMEEVIARESLHKNKRHDSHSVFSSGLDDILSISNNGSSMHIAESSLSLEKHTTSNGIQKGGFSVGITSLTGKADNIQDGVAQAGETSGLEGKMVQPLKGQSLSATHVLEKAKRALLVQKQLNEKLKKLPQVGKPTTQSAPTISLSSTIAVTSPSSTVPLPSVSATTLGEKQAPSPSISNQTVQAGLRGPGFSFMPGLIPSLPGIPAVSTASSLEAIKKVQEFAARLGLQQGPSGVPLLGVVPGQQTDDGTKAGQLKTVKAPVLRLDAQGREIDEHGNLVDRPKLTSLSTLKVNIKQQKREAFQILRPEIDEDPSSNPFYDPRMSLDNKKLMRPKRSTFQFVEEGRWSKQAEMLRLKSQFGEAQAKEIKAKQAALAKAKAEADINPNLIEVSERIPTKEEKVKDPIPEVEWWDVVLLPSGGYKDVTNSELKVKMEKLTIYVEHPVPIEPPAEPPPPPPQPLKLTKKEQKKLRTQRRLAKEKDRQEMIRQGLIEPPKPKVKMSNLMKVLGAEATQDPTKLEMEIRTAAAEREQAHTDRNLARKLTPAERREKKEKKLFDDANTLETIVSVYRVDDLSHPQTRFKVDINAQENRLTGCVVICDKMCAVVVEGGSKSIKRYGKLMLRRINWAAAVKDEGDGGEVQQVNKCALVWQGIVAKPSFDKFLIQQCRTEAAARKYLADAGVGHYWDLAANYSEE